MELSFDTLVDSFSSLMRGMTSLAFLEGLSEDISRSGMKMKSKRNPKERLWNRKLSAFEARPGRRNKKKTFVRNRNAREKAGKSEKSALADGDLEVNAVDSEIPKE